MKLFVHYIIVSLLILSFNVVTSQEQTSFRSNTANFNAPYAFDNVSPHSQRNTSDFPYDLNDFTAISFVTAPENTMSFSEASIQPDLQIAALQKKEPFDYFVLSVFIILLSLIILLIQRRFVKGDLKLF